MKVVAIMEDKEARNSFSRELAETVSDETSSVFAFLTGLINRLPNYNKTFETAGKRFSVQVNSDGDVTICPIKKKSKSDDCGL
jgi:hypothetical protein